MMKKVLALIMSIMLIVSLGTFSVSAEEVNSVDAAPETETGYYCEVALFMKESYADRFFGDMDPQPETEATTTTTVAADDTLDVGLGTEDTVEEESKGCVGGAVYLPIAAVVIAAALVIFKKRA